jgi:hypothetical protein
MKSSTRSSIRVRDTLGLLFVIGAAAVAFAGGVAAEIDVPAARLLVAECQGFEALATAGNAPLSCAPAVSLNDAVVPSTHLVIKQGDRDRSVDVLFPAFPPPARMSTAFAARV